ncbi:MAG: peptidoglycan-binding protein LysM [Gammaproteobacteria bacterium]|nr:peptidoglycan-binding protein LysM [Gammaproteobacteria bacterium]MDH3859805.1 peptidoglycan-binding protein LysM [Gammaproteobacteria bacterium]
MGLFDFAKDMGKKLFGGDDDPAEKIKESIEQDNPGINDLGVGYNEGVVDLSGKADSADAVEKAVLIAGNVKGVTEVNIDQMAAPAPAPEVEYYTIVSGDSLSKIAKNFYGNAMDYPKLFDANREVIKDPDLIYPGQKIRIPPKTW